MKKIGNIIELDPNKKYIMILDSKEIPIDAARKIINTKLENGTIILIPNPERAITFVENSDRIINIFQKGRVK